MTRRRDRNGFECGKPSSRRVVVGGKERGVLGRLAVPAVKLTFALFLISLIAVLLLRFIRPVSSAFMVERRCKDFFTSHTPKAITYDWVAWGEISPNMALAAVAAEDQKFPEHFGFDFESIADALEESGRLRGASTISQQVAKNLFLWKGKTFIRKGLEAYFTVLIELMWPKRRILEVYLNIAQFGDGIYGVQAAAAKFFGKPASQLTKKESAILAAVLPNPIRLKAAAPSAYVIRRVRWIEIQMRNLGQSYLREIWSP